MAFNKSVLVLFLASALMLSSTKLLVIARVLTTPVNEPGYDLATRLNGEGNGGMGECWSALLELRSCTNEIILFLVDGEAYLGLPCCRAIRIITRECWPTMLTSLGFSSEEGDILRGYCDTSSSPVAAPLSPKTATLPPVQSPAQAPVLGLSPSIVVA